ncbi:MAG: hypothetical protein QOJ64_1863 [Acidobacteriota bacterium]|jgi:cytochrome c553|nr:hypothetical protein [Acidobacteriota bacterium]
MMSEARQSKHESKPGVRLRSIASRKRTLSLVAAFLMLVCALVLVFVGSKASASPNEGAALAPEASSLAAPAQNYGNFSHFSPGEHAGLTNRSGCSSCHERRDNSAEPRFPGHRACISCHQTQFNTPGTPLCSICHTQEGLSQQNPPLKNFSNSLSGFRSDFDHQQHSVGDARPAANCAACHASARRGVAKSIPVGLNAHQTCYQCHTPGRQSGGVDISSCGACHAPGRFSPTSTSARSFRVGFSHGDHGPGQRLSCESCHNIGRRGLAQGAQVSSTFPQQHFPATRAQTCVTCHNGQRSFGETRFNDCKRCHTGPTFRL